MYTKWTQHLKTEKDKENFRNSILSARQVLERLRDILDEEANDRAETNEDTYNVANWSHLQAHRNGKREERELVKKIINLDQQKET